MPNREIEKAVYANLSIKIGKEIQKAINEEVERKPTKSGPNSPKSTRRRKSSLGDVPTYLSFKKVVAVFRSKSKIVKEKRQN